MTDGPRDEYQTLTTADGVKLARYLEDMMTWARQVDECLRVRE